MVCTGSGTMVNIIPKRQPTTSLQTEVLETQKAMQTNHLASLPLSGFPKSSLSKIF